MGIWQIREGKVGVTWRHGESSGSGHVVCVYIINIKSPPQFLNFCVFECKQSLLNLLCLCRGSVGFAEV